MKTQTPTSPPRAPKSETRDPFPNSPRIKHLESSIQNRCRSSADRPALVAILEEFGVSVAGFDALRSDTYEKHIATRSLTELEGLYRTLLAPSGSYEEKQKLCPVWKKGGQGEDKLPDITTLSRIKHRIRAGQMVEDVDEKMERLRAMVERLAGVPVSQKT